MVTRHSGTLASSVTVVDERNDLSDLDSDESPETKAMLLLHRAYLMPPVSSVGTIEGGPVIVSGKHGLTADQINQIEALLADIPHRVVAGPVEPAINYGGSDTPHS